jgi:hypothetical protein
MFYILGDVSVWHPLRDHGDLRIGRVVPTTDSNEPQYVRIV